MISKIKVLQVNISGTVKGLKLGNVGRGWVQEFKRRNKLVKRRVGGNSSSLPPNFLNLKAVFLKEIEDARRQHCIPPSLIVNIDETGINLLPSSDYTLVERESNNTELAQYGDKRQITVTLGVSLFGDLLPPQIIFEVCFRPVYSSDCSESSVL